MNLKSSEENYEDFDIEKGTSNISIVCKKYLLLEKTQQAALAVESIIPFFIINSDLLPFRNNWSLSPLKLTPLSFTNLFVRLCSSILLIFYCIHRYYLNNRVDESSETKMKIKKAFDFIVNYLFCDELETIVCLFVSLNNMLTCIGKALGGECTTLGFRNSYIEIVHCNLLAKSHSPPIESLVLWFMSILLLQFFFRQNLRKSVLYFMWFMAAAITWWSVIFMRSWGQLWLFPCSLVFLIVLYLNERYHSAYVLLYQESLDAALHRNSLESDLNKLKNQLDSLRSNNESMKPNNHNMSFKSIEKSSVRSSLLSIDIHDTGSECESEFKEREQCPESPPAPQLLNNDYFSFSVDNKVNSNRQSTDNSKYTFPPKSGDEKNKLLFEINGSSALAIYQPCKSNTPVYGLTPKSSIKASIIKGSNKKLHFEDSHSHQLVDYMDDTSSHVAPPIHRNFDMNTLVTDKIIQNKLTLEHFTDIKYFCDGSHSNVYKGVLRAKDHSVDNKIVILKVLKEKSMGNSLAHYEFRKEIIILSKINHPNIVQIYGEGSAEASNRPMIVMESLEGNSVGHHLKLKRAFSSRLFTESRYLYIGKEFASALKYIHHEISPECVLIHRDLKPDNVCFTCGGTLKIIDFGIATCLRKGTAIDETYNISGCTGTLRYMAPEVALNKPYNEKVDIYGFGLVMYEIITGITPFKGPKYFPKTKFYSKVVVGNERPPLYTDVYGRDINMNETLRELLAQCWHEDYRQRPSAQVIYDIIQSIEKKSYDDGDEMKNANNV